MKKIRFTVLIMLCIVVTTSIFVCFCSCKNLSAYDDTGHGSDTYEYNTERSAESLKEVRWKEDKKIDENENGHISVINTLRKRKHKIEPMPFITHKRQIVFKKML